MQVETSVSDRSRRADAARNERTLLAAAADVFVAHGVDAPVRRIAEAAGVGVGTIYRHFPNRADLVVAVFRHQIDACADAASDLLARSETPALALHAWVDVFVEFLVTKHGLAEALQDPTRSAALHAEFVATMVPACTRLLDAALPEGGRPRISGYAFLRAIGNLSIGGRADDGYDVRAVAHIFVDGVVGGSADRGASARADAERHA